MSNISDIASGHLQEGKQFSLIAGYSFPINLKKILYIMIKTERYVSNLPYDKKTNPDILPKLDYAKISKCGFKL